MIRFIIPYYGKWPVWMPLFLESCRRQDGYQWVLVGSDKVCYELPQNVRFVELGLEDIRDRIEASGLPVPKVFHPYKLCDYKPAYGLIFADLLKGANFWGHTDIDLAYGRLSEIVNEKFLSDIDVFSADDRSCGHFQIFRNENNINQLVLHIPDIASHLSLISYVGMDEPGMSIMLAQDKEVRWYRAASRRDELTSQRPMMGATIEPCGHIIGQKINDVASYLWEDGRAFQVTKDGNRIEFLYLHWFQWKNFPEKWRRLFDSYEWEKKAANFELKQWAVHKSKTKNQLRTWLYKILYRLNACSMGCLDNCHVLDKASALVHRQLLNKKELEKLL